MWGRIVLGLLAVLGAATPNPRPLWADGDHGGASRAIREEMGDGRYDLWITLQPNPLLAGRPAVIKAQIVDRASGEILRGARVQMSIPGWLPPSLRQESAAKGPVPDEIERERQMAIRSLQERVRADLHVGQVLPGPADEVAPGVYALEFTPLAAEPYDLHVSLPNRDGRPDGGLTSVVVAMPVTWEWPVNPRLLLVAVAVLGLAGSALLILRLRGDDLAPGERFNFLAIPWFRRIVTSPGFLPAMQVPLAFLFAIIVFLGIADTAVAGRNLATKLTWTIWWAGIIFTFVLVGRLWCLMCPIGAVNEWASRLAQPTRRWPAPLRNLWIANGSFVLLTLADVQLGVVRDPRVTACIILLLLASAVLTGLLFQRRTFCRYLCPITGLIGIYAMVAPLELRVKRCQTCGTHREKECFVGGPANVGCPMFERPWEMDTNAYCNLCFECVKGCGRDNLVLRLRAFGADLWRAGERRLDEAYFAVVLAGASLFLTGEMVQPWRDAMDWIGTRLPHQILGGVSHKTMEGLISSAAFLVVTLGVVPLSILAAAWGTQRLLLRGGKRHELRQIFTVFGYMFIPIGLCTHLAHNLHHLFDEGPGIVPVLQRTINRFTSVSAGVPAWDLPAILPHEVVYWMQMLLVMGFYGVSLYAGSRLARRHFSNAETTFRAAAPMIVVSLLLMLVNVYVLSQPMAARHSH
ncbi:MAG TPA: 4Fe-4S binding protein [Candidatus Methylomirabilis sp.]|nr:4Fe-4S binding protein [Candidatus Methylomirabilis sp.]